MLFPSSSPNINYCEPSSDFFINYKKIVSTIHISILDIFIPDMPFHQFGMAPNFSSQYQTIDPFSIQSIPLDYRRHASPGRENCNQNI